MHRDLKPDNLGFSGNVMKLVRDCNLSSIRIWIVVGILFSVQFPIGYLFSSRLPVLIYQCV